jgi:hypothetical protein
MMLSAAKFACSAPNTALHRTPSASPLAPVSFQTFGDLK